MSDATEWVPFPQDGQPVDLRNERGEYRGQMAIAYGGCLRFASGSGWHLCGVFTHWRPADVPGDWYPLPADEQCIDVRARRGEGAGCQAVYGLTGLMVLSREWRRQYGITQWRSALHPVSDTGNGMPQFTIQQALQVLPQGNGHGYYVVTYVDGALVSSSHSYDRLSEAIERAQMIARGDCPRCLNRETRLKATQARACQPESGALPAASAPPADFSGNHSASGSTRSMDSGGP